MAELDMKNEAEPETEDFTTDELCDEALDREGAVSSRGCVRPCSPRN
jgi:hypothetical protein